MLYLTVIDKLNLFVPQLIKIYKICMKMLEYVTENRLINKNTLISMCDLILLILLCVNIISH